MSLAMEGFDLLKRDLGQFPLAGLAEIHGDARHRGEDQKLLDAQHIEDAPVAVIPGAGHNAPLTHPGDSFSYDLFSQVGAAVRTQADLVLGGLEHDHHGRPADPDARVDHPGHEAGADLGAAGVELGHDLQPGG